MKMLLDSRNLKNMFTLTVAEQNGCPLHRCIHTHIYTDICVFIYTYIHIYMGIYTHIHNMLHVDKTTWSGLMSPVNENVIQKFKVIQRYAILSEY